MTWREHANCAGADGRLFFPTLPPGRRPADADPRNPATQAWQNLQDIAELYCGDCPVIEDCDDEAETAKPRMVGLWAGVLRRWRNGKYERHPLLHDAAGEDTG